MAKDNTDKSTSCGCSIARGIIIAGVAAATGVPISIF